MAPRSASGKSNSTKRSKKPQKFWTHVHLGIFCLVISLFLSIIIGGMLYLLASLNLPDITSVVHYRPTPHTTILAADGTVLDRIYEDKRSFAPLEDMPDLLPKAFIAAEDARFRQHRGIDIPAILRAFVHNLKVDRPEEGGSTITQQTARMLLLNREKSYLRKIKEVILAIRIEQLLNKEEIFRIYLNRIYLGEGAYGVKAAALIYFDKRISELNLSEIALLAGLPQAPSRYSPFNNFALAKRRQAYTLNRMSEEGFIAPSEAKKAYRSQLALTPSLPDKDSEENGETGYFLQHIRNYITEKYAKELRYSGGLTIHTTLDPAIQEKAVNAVLKGITRWKKRHPGRSSAPQAGLVAMETETGRVKALVGGKSYVRSQFNRATQARRQPGSAFKPIIYAAALEKGYTPVTLINDAPLELTTNKTGRTWQPHNFSDDYYGPTTLYTGLVHSRNIVAVKLLQKTGITRVKRLAHNLGISSPLADNPALALGTSEISLLELTAAYSTFANQGKFNAPVFIDRITDKQGKIIEDNTARGQRVLSRESAYQLTHILQAVIDEGTGEPAKGLESDSAGKTGTTDKQRDGWFIGYSPELAAGIWMGFDRGKSLGERETGGKACAPVWLDFMKKISSGDREFQPPEEIVFGPFDKKSGDYQPDNENMSDWLPFKKGNLPLNN